MGEGRIIHLRKAKLLKRCPELLCRHAPEQWSQWESYKIRWSLSRKKVITAGQTLLNAFCGHLGSFFTWRRQSPACGKGGMCGGSYPSPVGSRRLCVSWCPSAAVKSFIPMTTTLLLTQHLLTALFNFRVVFGRSWCCSRTSSQQFRKTYNYLGKGMFSSRWLPDTSCGEASNACEYVEKITPICSSSMGKSSFGFLRRSSM